MTTWTRTILFVVITAAFLGLAVSILVLGGPWYLAAAYVGCAAITGALAHRSRPTADRAGVVTPAGQAKRARRSGNPAVRAQSEQRDRPR